MASAKKKELDFSKFPPGTVTEYNTLVCLACIFDIFTTQLGLAPRTAYTEIKRYAPTVEELTARQAVRPFFDSPEKNPHCPYCNAAKRWHARLDTYGIEGSKPVDAARREFIKSLPTKDEQFRVSEHKSDRRQVFFDWLDTIKLDLDLNDRRWLLEVTQAYLSRVDPKTDWAPVFEDLRTVRPSRRLESGWEREGARLYLTPALYNDVLVIQYLVSRSHTHGGHTFEGRLTFAELLRRLRFSGYLKQHEIIDGDQFEVFEQVLDKLSGGTGAVKTYYVVDRRDFLEKVRVVYAKYAA